jgi:hypothetical protein
LRIEKTIVDHRLGRSAFLSVNSANAAAVLAKSASEMAKLLAKAAIRGIKAVKAILTGGFANGVGGFALGFAAIGVWEGRSARSIASRY